MSFSCRRLSAFAVCFMLLGLGSCLAPTGALAADAGCQQSVTLPLVTATTSGCFTQNPDDSNQYTTSDPVVLNGVTVPAAPDTQTSINMPSDSAPGGSISATSSVTVAGFTLQQQVISQNFPTGGNGDEGDFVALAPDRDQKFLGLDVTGSSVAWRVGRDADGNPFSKFAVVLALPSVLKNGPGQDAGGLTGTVAFKVNQDGSVSTDAVKLEVADAYVGTVQLRNLCFSYTASGSSTTPCSPPPFGAHPLITCTSGNDANRWDGSGLVVLPTNGRPELGVFAGLRDGSLSYAGGEASNLGNNLPLAEDVYLDKFGLGLCLNPSPFSIKGAAGIRFGPGNTGYLDGSIEYVNSSPWQIKADGALSLHDTQVGDGHLKYLSTGDIDFNVNAAMSIASGALKADGSLTGWYQAAAKRFDMFGTGKVCVAKIPQGCLGGDVAVSNVGVAACVKLGGLRGAADQASAAAAGGGGPTAYAAWGFGSFVKSVSHAFSSGASQVFGAAKQFGTQFVSAAKSIGQKAIDIVQNGLRVGAGYKWGGSVELMGDSCDVGPYRAQKAAVIAAGGPPETITIPGGLGVVVHVRGEGAPPKVELVSPKGDDVIRADTNGEFRGDEFAYTQDTSTKSTDITIPDPEAGDWKIHVMRGSSTVLSVSQANLERPPMATGEVVGEGHERTLDYIYERHADQEVQFVERGGDDEKVIGMAQGHECKDITLNPVPVGDSAHPECGEIHFSPGPGPAGKRKIVAVIMRGGEPVQEIPVTEYEAPGEQRLAAPQGVTIQRVGSRVSVTWMRVEHADTYDIQYRLGDGEDQVLVEPSNADTVTLPEAVDPADQVVVRVSGVKSSEQPGPGSEATSPGNSADGPPMPEGA